MIFEHSLSLPFFGIVMKTDLFQSLPSLPLDLFIVMLPKAHLTSHSRMSGSK